MEAATQMDGGYAFRRALVVEGDPDLLQSLCEALQAAGIEAAPAETGEVAIAKLERGLNADFVLLDLCLPRMPGDEVLERLKHDSRWRHVPVAAMTSCPRDGLGASPLPDVLLPKPFTLEMLEEAVAALGGGHFVTP